MAEGTFPPIPEAEKQPWVKRLGSHDRAAYEETRKKNIEADREALLVMFDNIEGFESVSREVIGYTALRLATAMVNGWECGIQVGIEGANQIIQAEVLRRHSVEVNRLGGYG